MENKLFLAMVDIICDFFQVDCEGCPLKDLWKKKECSSCEYFLDHYQNDAELVLATWIGGVDFVEALGEQEKKKEPGTRREILEAADRCVCGDRDDQYGRPENSFRAIAAFWTQYIMSKCVPKKTTVDIGPDDVAAMMVLFKMARVATGQNKADNWIDGAGYCACGGEIAAAIKEE